MHSMGKSRADDVYQQTEQRLIRLLAGDEAAVRGQLANLRRGAGKKPGEDPRVWGILFSGLPEEMLGYSEPTIEEWAIHTALTLFSVHQQSNDPHQHNMNQKGVSLGTAASRLVAASGRDDNARERVARRFHQVVLAPDMPSMAYHLRSFIQLLRSADIGLDYPRLAKDLYRYQLRDGASSVRLAWGQDFYRTEKTDNPERKED